MSQNEDKMFNVLTNPDGYNYNWIIPIFNHETNRNHLFMPLLSRDLNNKPKGILVEVDQVGPHKYRVSNHWSNIHDIKRYVYKFYGLTKQLYHPNEIMAHLLANYVVLDHIFTNTMDTFDYFKFYRFLNKYFITINFIPFRNR